MSFRVTYAAPMNPPSAGYHSCSALIWIVKRDIVQVGTDCLNQNVEQDTDIVKTVS